MTALAFGMNRRDLDELVGGSCSEVDPELFFPLGTQRIQFEDAATVCWYCPVKDACLEGARARREPWGVWGGVNFEVDPNAEPFDPTSSEFCGTPAGYSRHRKRDQEVCPACKAARTEHDRKARAMKAQRLRGIPA